MLLFGYCRPPSKELERCASILFSRLSERVVVSKLDIIVREWRPTENECHFNARYLTLLDPTYKPVHGWLYIEGLDALGFVRFASHSVVEDSDGILFDITPCNSDTTKFGFIRSRLSSDLYDKLVDDLISVHGSSNCLDHLLVKAKNC